MHERGLEQDPHDLENSLRIAYSGVSVDEAAVGVARLSEAWAELAGQAVEQAVGRESGGA